MGESKNIVTSRGLPKAASTTLKPGKGKDYKESVKPGVQRSGGSTKGK